MVYCLTASNHYLNQCWRDITGIHPIAISRKMRKICWQKWSFNIEYFYAPAKGQDGGDLATIILKARLSMKTSECYHFFYWMSSCGLFLMMNQHWFKCIVKTWRRSGDRPSSKPMRPWLKGQQESNNVWQKMSLVISHTVFWSTNVRNHW